MFKYNELKENVKYKVINHSHKFAIGETRVIVGDKIFQIKDDKSIRHVGNIKDNYKDWEFMLVYPDSIEEAAKQLDAHHPGWAEKINIEKFDITHYKYCILGQLYGEFKLGIKVLYNIDTGVIGLDKIFGQNASKDEWIKEIASRTKQSMEKPKALTYIEAWKALTEGKKIRGKQWGPGIYWHNDSGCSIQVSWQDGTKVDAPLYGINMEWEIY